MIPVKIDTGASFTVIGLKNDQLSQFADEIRQHKIKDKASDASDNKIQLYEYIVENFKLTKEIIIPKIKLYFSDDIKNKALIGMDILSLFDFQYLKDGGISHGTFWINNYEIALDKLKDRTFNKDLDYIDPGSIYSIEELDENYDNTTEKDSTPTHDLGYIDNVSVNEVSEQSETKVKSSKRNKLNLTMQDAEAAYIHKRIKEN